MVQYADDLTLFMPDLECAQRIFHLFDQYEACSGLKVNYTKAEAIGGLDRLEIIQRHLWD